MHMCLCMVVIGCLNQETLYAGMISKKKANVTNRMGLTHCKFHF